MRADRLVAIVLLLQTHGRLSAAEIAERLETSERTVRRDLDALGVAGVPVYAQRGRNGGWSLLGGHRIDLTGLTPEEAQALLLATDSGSATLGPVFAERVAAARRKVLAALPDHLRDRVGAAAGAVLIDGTGWGTSARRPRTLPPERAGDPAHLAALRRAVVMARQVDVCYQPEGRPAEMRRLHPHGLVCKRGVWYLVATAPAGLRTYRVSRVRDVEVSEEAVVVPENFDLAVAWNAIQDRFAAERATPVVVDVEVPASLLARLEATVGAWWPWAETGPVAGQESVAVQLRFPHPGIAARELLPLAEHLVVISPDEVRAELVAIARRLLERHGPGPAQR